MADGYGCAPGRWVPTNNPTSFGVFCDALASEGDAVEVAAAHAFALVGRWLADGLLSRDG